MVVARVLDVLLWYPQKRRFQPKTSKRTKKHGRRRKGTRNVVESEEEPSDDTEDDETKERIDARDFLSTGKNDKPLASRFRAASVPCCDLVAPSSRKGMEQATGTRLTHLLATCCIPRSGPPLVSDIECLFFMSWICRYSRVTNHDIDHDNNC
jgi:hypothetical protein